jgi:NitT/TauT family transport system substrate-binding protein
MTAQGALYDTSSAGDISMNSLAFLARISWPVAAFLTAMVTSLRPALAAPKMTPVTFGLDWRAEAEYGGYYQALATGIYKKYGLDVSIRQGGPEVNNAQLLVARRLTFDITSNSFLAFNFVQEHIPFLAVAAFFQKDPDVLIAHPNEGEDSFKALKGKPIALASDSRASWWLYLKHKYGYSDSQIRPYGFSLTPWFTNKHLAIEGYLTSEPFLIKQKTGQYPVVLQLAKSGFNGYAQLVATSDRLIKTHPSLVQRFIDASIAGWKSYLYSNPAPAFAAIQQANPDMSTALLHYGYVQLKQHGLVDSGDAKTMGIGVMTDARWRAFFNQMAAAGLYSKGLDYKQAFTTRFVDHPGIAATGDPATGAPAH